MNRKFIVVKTQFEGIHRYPTPPEEVFFLIHPHRHMFHVEVEVEVFHDDRELEFIVVKRDLEGFIQFKYGSLDLGAKSCEMIAQEIQDYLKKIWHLDAKTHPDRSYRIINVKVLEDGENGCYLKEEL